MQDLVAQAQADMPSVAEAGCAEIAKLMTTPEYRPMLKSAGGIEVLCPLLTSRVPGIKTQVARALANVCQDEKYHEAVIQAGGGPQGK